MREQKNRIHEKELTSGMDYPYIYKPTISIFNIPVTLSDKPRGLSVVKTTKLGVGHIGNVTMNKIKKKIREMNSLS